ncbi:MAG: hypothetical protein AABX51_01580, partial [Nanoarchaeota archaeon]
ELEIALVPMLMRAAESGKWVGIGRQGNQVAAHKAVEKGFGFEVTYGGALYLLPSASYIDHCRENLK